MADLKLTLENDFLQEVTRIHKMYQQEIDNHNLLGQNLQEETNQLRNRLAKVKGNSKYLKKTKFLLN